MECRPGVSRCIDCGRWSQTSSGLAKLAKSECSGVCHSLGQALASGSYVVVEGHSLMRTDNIRWCLKCGRYAEAKVGKLRDVCPRKPTYATGLKRLLAGKHPFSGVRLAVGAMRVTLDEWSRWSDENGMSMYGITCREVV